MERRPKICQTAKGCLSGPGSPPEDPTRVKSSLFPRIGLVRDSKCLSLGVLARKKVFVSSVHGTVSHNQRETIPTPCVSDLQLEPPSRCKLSATSNPANGGTVYDPMKSVYGQWVQAWSPKLKQPSDDLRKKSYEQKRNRPRRRRRAQKTAPKTGSRWR